MIWFQLNGKWYSEYGFDYKFLTHSKYVDGFLFIFSFIVDVWVCLMFFLKKNDKQTHQQQAWHVDPDEYQVSLFFILLRLHCTNMDIWHHALDSSTSAICIWCNLWHTHAHTCTYTFKYTLPNRLIWRLRLQKRQQRQQPNDKVKIVHSHLQLFDWMTAQRKKGVNICITKCWLSVSHSCCISFFRYMHLYVCTRCWVLLSIPSGMIVDPLWYGFNTTIASPSPLFHFSCESI